MPLPPDCSHRSTRARSKAPLPRAFLVAIVGSGLLLAAGCARLPGAPDEATPLEVTVKPGAKAVSPITPDSAAPALAAAARDRGRTFPGSGIFMKPSPVVPPPSGAEEISLNFEATEIRQVAATILSDILKESFTVHPSVQGTVSLRTVKPIPRSALLPTLEMLLRQNGAALVYEDSLYKIVPTAIAARGSVTPQLGTVGAPLRSGFGIAIAPVRFVGAKEMARLLEPFVVDQSSVRVDEVRNLLILQGTQREIKHLLDTIDLFDVDFLAGMSVGIFPLQGADVKALTADLDKVFGPAATGPLAGIVRVVPIERLNALLIVTTQPRYLEMAQTWIERLDRSGGASGGTRIFVYPVQNGKAENLAALLSEIFSSKRTTTANPSLAPGSRPGEIRSPTTPNTAGVTGLQPPQTAGAPGTTGTVSFEGDGAIVSKDVRVIADKDNNALVVLASPADYDKIENAIKKLDVIPRQVLIEVLIAEVTLTDDLKYGIDWFINARSGLSSGASGIPERNITTGTSNLGGLPLTPTGAVPAFTGLQLINSLGGDVRAVLNALGGDSRLKIVSSPSLMVIDNQKAQIQVGSKIPTLASTQSGITTGTTTGVISSINYLETGILLSVSPRVNTGGRITLEISQEVSEAATTTSSGIDSPTITRRTAQSVVSTQSGEPLIFAGLIQKKRSFSTSGIPLLSKIPIIGGAFGSQTFHDEQTELVLIITPRLVADINNARDALDDLRKKMPALKEVFPLSNNPANRAAPPESKSGAKPDARPEAVPASGSEASK
jgi:general secretion pathway protein D